MGDCRFLEAVRTHYRHRHDAGAQGAIRSASSSDFDITAQDISGARNCDDYEMIKRARVIISSHEESHHQHHPHHLQQQFDQCCASAESSSCSLPMLLQQRCEVMLDRKGAQIDVTADDNETGVDGYGSHITHNNHIEIINDKECSMCGDLGIAKKLFKCVRCPHRFQHTYCSRSYPHNVVLICNWCLHMDELDRKPPLQTAIIKHPNNVNTQTAHGDEAMPKDQIELAGHHDHSKAFEYLLQIAATTFNHSTSNQDTLTISNITESRGLLRQASTVKDAGAKKEDSTGKCKVGSLSSCTLSRANGDDADHMLEIMERHVQKRQRCTKSPVGEEQSRCHYKRHTSNNSCTQAALGSLSNRWKQVTSKRSHNPLQNSSPTPTKGISNRRYKLLADVLC